MRLVDAGGVEVATVGGKTKRAHDPERVQRERKRLEAELENCKAGWERDRAQKLLAGSTDNIDAITEHWNAKYQAVALGIDKSIEPVDVVLDAFAKWVTDRLEHEERQRIYNLPLKEVKDLTGWEFKLVGVCEELGTVWLCDVCALCVAQDGMVLVMLRHKTDSLNAWVNNHWLEHHVWISLVHELPDLTLGELFTLLKALRYTKVGAIPEGLMNMARGGAPATTKGPVEAGYDGERNDPNETAVR